jgi:outer membrane protein insertion porin family
VRERSGSRGSPSRARRRGVKGSAKVTSDGLLDQGTLDLDAGKIAEAYAEEGYPRAKVLAKTDPAGPGVVQVTFVIDEGPKVKVRDVVFHTTGGVRTFKPEDLRSAMKSKTPGFLGGGTFKPSQLDQDATQLRLFMRSRGYKDADVDSIRPVYTEDGKGVALHVYVREGARYRFGTASWSGNTVIPTPVLNGVTTVQQGTPYSEMQIHKTSRGRAVYQEQGFLYLSIEPKPIERDSIVDIEFAIRRGRVPHHDLDIIGNTRTKEKVVRRRPRSARGTSSGGHR